MWGCIASRGGEKGIDRTYAKARNKEKKKKRPISSAITNSKMDWAIKGATAPKVPISGENGKRAGALTTTNWPTPKGWTGRLQLTKSIHQEA